MITASKGSIGNNGQPSRTSVPIKFNTKKVYPGGGGSGGGQNSSFKLTVSLFSIFIVFLYFI